jgi:hypothetical protein
MQNIITMFTWLYQLPFVVVLVVNLLLGIFFAKGIFYFFPVIVYGESPRYSNTLCMHYWALCFW